CIAMSSHSSTVFLNGPWDISLPFKLSETCKRPTPISFVRRFINRRDLTPNEGRSHRRSALQHDSRLLRRQRGEPKNRAAHGRRRGLSQAKFRPFRRQREGGLLVRHSAPGI